MSKKNIDMVAITPKKANAQSLTCFITFIATVCLSTICMVTACLLPVWLEPTKIICWVAMAFEAIAIVFGFIAYWIKRNAL